MKVESLEIEIAPKRDALLNWLGELPGAAVAFSGGVDSAVVAQAAFLALGSRAIAITADSPSVPRSEIALAREVATRIGIAHRVVNTNEFENPDYTRNAGDRCYFCKSELYSRIQTLLPELGFEIILSGANLDDLGDYRPGLIAAAERGIRHPLQEAKFTKADVRSLAKHWNLPVWDKPASPCLSSRLAPGLAVTPERTLRVELGEAFLKTLGLCEARVRYHEGELARVEVPNSDLSRFLDPELRTALAKKLKELGFKYVSLDLEGFRSGGLNDLISLDLKRKFALPRAS